MRDLTAILMGDPSATYRRPPTERERTEPKHGAAYEQQRVRTIVENTFAHPAGSERIFSSWQKARNFQKMLNAKGFKASLRSNDDGTYLVRRIG